MLANKTLTEMIETAPTPILLWNLPGDRLGKVLWQYVFMLSLLTAGLAFTTLFASITLALLIVSGIGLTASIIGFCILYFSDGYYEYSRGLSGKEAKLLITNNIHEAAQCSLDRQDRDEINLSAYVNLDRYRFGTDTGYLESLSDRHIKRAKKLYAKSIEEIRYANTEGKRKQEELLAERVSALDEASNEKRIRELTYELDALKSLEQNTLLTESEKLDREFEKL